MATVRYTCVNGEMIAEKRGAVRKFYVPDPSGSTVALLDNTQTKTDTYVYWPYGEERSSTGSTPTPFRFMGFLECYRDGSNRNYIGARYYQPNIGRWTTGDVIGYQSGSNPYGYAGGNPTTPQNPYEQNSKPPSTGSWLDRFLCHWFGLRCPPAHQLINSMLAKLISALPQSCSDCLPTAGNMLTIIKEIKDLIKCNTFPEQLACDTRSFCANPDEPGMCSQWCRSLISWLKDCMAGGPLEDIIFLLDQYRCYDICNRYNIYN